MQHPHLSYYVFTRVRNCTNWLREAAGQEHSRE